MHLNKRRERYNSNNIQRTGEGAFQNCWSLAIKKPTYDALNDPHASLYFMNQTMKKHLKGLQKVL